MLLVQIDLVAQVEDQSKNCKVIRYTGNPQRLCLMK
jgi:hypothetical protein